MFAFYFVDRFICQSSFVGLRVDNRHLLPGDTDWSSGLTLWVHILPLHGSWLCQNSCSCWAVVLSRRGGWDPFAFLQPFCSGLERRIPESSWFYWDPSVAVSSPRTSGLAVCDPLSCTAQGPHHQPSGLYQATLCDPLAPQYVE